MMKEFPLTYFLDNFFGDIYTYVCDQLIIYYFYMAKRWVHRWMNAGHGVG